MHGPGPDGPGSGYGCGAATPGRTPRWGAAAAAAAAEDSWDDEDGDEEEEEEEDWAAAAKGHGGAGGGGAVAALPALDLSRVSFAATGGAAPGEGLGHLRQDRPEVSQCGRPGLLHGGRGSAATG